MRSRFEPAVAASSAPALPQQQARRAEALTALGRLYLTQGFSEQALALLLAARRAAPQDPGLLRLLACAYVMAGAADKALPVLDALEGSLSDEEDIRAALHLRARALMAMGRQAEARAIFDERRRH